MALLLELFRRYERGRRFWRHVDVRGRDECWPWRGPGDPAATGADARAYELARGPLPRGARVAHRCGSPRCVNPGHMDVVARDQKAH